MRRRVFAFSTVGLPALFLATREAAAEPPVDKDKEGRAVLGNDVVAIWTDKKVIPGTAENSFVWRGARWQFASPQNLALFAANPTRYAPEYGGHCAVSMAAGKLTRIAKPSWSIYQGRLFFNYDDRVKQNFDYNGTAGIVSTADGQWRAKYGNL